MEHNFYYYNSILDAVVMKDNDDNELVIECIEANAQVVFDEPEDESCRSQRKTPETASVTGTASALCFL